MDTFKKILGKCWQLIVGLILGIITILSFRKPKNIQKPDDMTDIEKDFQKKRVQEADENKAKANQLSQQLDDLKKKRTMFSIFLLALLLSGLLCGKIYAEPTMPDHKNLQKLYISALDTIQSLKADLNEAIEIAEGFKALYESESRLRLDAENAVTRGLERERQLNELLIEQHKTIMDLATRRKLGITLGAMYLDKPGLFAGVTF